MAAVRMRNEDLGDLIGVILEEARILLEVSRDVVGVHPLHPILG